LWFQLLFTIAYQLKGEFRGEGKELLAAAVHALQDPAPEVVPYPPPPNDLSFMQTPATSIFTK
jgi:hypothetical protein